ncbi:DUF4344 domain-containing metallopeptidase [Mycolicibacterium sp.]|uniref:DUF4344 domain-containing metallopeptidase n=1 Tax=Mycolicibacterium sp. TaxID=2320850 RepID=UPI001A19E42D|nr:DUF4344 domain-containing metallopeptidase [Mycolicibacterium sp.]
MRHGIPCMVAVVGLLAVGCGAHGGTQATSSTSAANSATISAANSPARAAGDNDADSGQMTVVYEDATTPEAIQGKELMQATGLLESLAQEVNDWFVLPYDIPVVGSQCGEANDFWDPDEKKVILCYEDVDNSLQLFSDDPDPAAAARRIAVGAFYHELGHMAIDIYDLPVTGREEDVADQLAAYWLLEPVDGKVNADNLQAAKDTADWYNLASAAPADLDEESFADEHTVDQSRAYNFQCWIYGSDTQANADIVSSGLLPEDRAADCEGEYEKLARAWGELLEPHYKS